MNNQLHLERIDSQELNIETAKAEDLGEILQLLRTVRSAADVDFYEVRWHWLRQNPEDDNSRTVIVAKQSGRIVGHIVQIVTRMFVYQNELKAVFTADLVVHPMHRRQGIGTALLRFVRDHTDMIFTMDSSENAASIERKTGHAQPFYLARRVKYFDARPLVNQVYLRRVLNRVLDPLLRKGISKPRTFVVEAFNTNKVDDLDGLFRSSIKKNRIISLRSPDFIRWRFHQAQFRTMGYNILMARLDGEIVGYMVSRVTPSGDFAEGVIVDFLVHDDNPAVLSELINHTHDYFRQNDVAISSCYCNLPKPLARVLRDNGYLPHPTQKPMDYRYWISETVGAKLPTINKEHFYITGLDGDSDLN